MHAEPARKAPSLAEAIANLENARWTCDEHQVEYGHDPANPFGKRWECSACEMASRRAERNWLQAWALYEHWDRGSGIPYRFHRRTRANWRRTGKNQTIGKALDAYAANLREHLQDGTGLVLLGPPGLGKTHLLAALTADAIAAGAFARYAVWPDVVAEVKASFNLPRDVERGDLVGELKAAPFLALDELALKPNATEYEHGLLFELIDYRYREQLPTVAASNATLASLPSAVGERIADRLTECGPTLVLSGTSQRLAAASSTDLAAAAPQLEKPTDTLTVREHRQGQWHERVIKRPNTGRPL